jgi:paraquat-inducible protein B
MAKRVSPTAIGAFVVVSFAILIAVIVVAGSGRLFRKPLQFICMFQGDLNGLKVGAPVKVRGVQIGSVAAIRLRLSPSEGRLRQNVTELRLPVILELDRSQLTAQGGTGQALGQAGFEDMIKRGMRAQLRTESLLTGLLYIDLDLHPKAPLNLAIEPGSGPYREIPTVPTQLAAIQEQATNALAKFEEIDFEALARSITDAANSIKDLTGSPALAATLESLKETTANLNRTVVSVRTTVDHANTKLGPLADSFQRNSGEVNETLKETRETLVDLQSTLDPDSPLAIHLNEALDQMTDTTRTIGAFVDYLQQNPSSLVRGRYVPDKAQ